MSSPKAINQKKIILSTTEVSQLLLSKGRKRINESFSSHNPKVSNKLDITELTSQINLKLSKEGEGGMGLADQSMFKGVLEKSVLFKSNKALDRSGFFNNFDKFNAKENLNILSKLEKSQLDKDNNNIGDILQEVKSRKKILKFDTKDMVSDKNQIKISNIINNYFPYENENNGDLESTNKIKNYNVIFYFKIETITFVLIKKLDKKFVPLYFWNREEDAIKFGINYSQITTPGLYFKTFENFTNAFKNKINERDEIVRLNTIIKEKHLSYGKDMEVMKNEKEKLIQNIKKENEENIKNIRKEYEEILKNIKNEYEVKAKKLENENNNLKNKITEIENLMKIKDSKIKESSKNIKDLNEDIKILRLVNDKLKKDNLENVNKSNKYLKKENKIVNSSFKNLNSLINFNNSISENEKESESEINSNLNKIKSNANVTNVRGSKKAKTRISSFAPKNDNFNNKLNEKYLNKFENNINEKENKLKTINKKYLVENIFQIQYFPEEISMPKLEEYFIENEEEDEINSVNNIQKIKTYGDKGRNESFEKMNNNVVLYINENTDNKYIHNNKNKIQNYEDEKTKPNYNFKKKYEEKINAKDQEILILRNKIKSLNLEIQNKSKIIEELKYLIESKSNNNSDLNFNSESFSKNKIENFSND